MRYRRFGAALALAAMLSTGIVVSSGTAYAGTGTPTASQGQLLAAVCTSITAAIARLEALKPGPLRDLLLAALRRAQSTYCR